MFGEQKFTQEPNQRSSIKSSVFFPPLSLLDNGVNNEKSARGLKAFPWGIFPAVCFGTESWTGLRRAEARPLSDAFGSATSRAGRQHLSPPPPPPSSGCSESFSPSPWGSTLAVGILAAIWEQACAWLWCFQLSFPSRQVKWINWVPQMKANCSTDSKFHHLKLSKDESN